MKILQDKIINLKKKIMQNHKTIVNLINQVKKNDKEKATMKIKKLMRFNES
jgi:hypothetical protein